LCLSHSMSHANFYSTAIRKECRVIIVFKMTSARVIKSATENKVDANWSLFLDRCNLTAQTERESRQSRSFPNMWIPDKGLCLCRERFCVRHTRKACHNYFLHILLLLQPLSMSALPNSTTLYLIQKSAPKLISCLSRALPLLDSHWLNKKCEKFISIKRPGDDDIMNRDETRLSLSPLPGDDENT
jgi:hypothetical protein